MARSESFRALRPIQRTARSGQARPCRAKGSSRSPSSSHSSDVGESRRSGGVPGHGWQGGDGRRNGVDPRHVGPGGARPSNARVAIVGAGLAGLACADASSAKGVHRHRVSRRATRVGGRCFVAPRFLPRAGRRAGRRVHRHAGTRRCSAMPSAFGLALEDVTRGGRARSCISSTASYSEATVVDEYRALRRRDARRPADEFSGAPTARRPHRRGYRSRLSSSLDEYSRRAAAGSIVAGGHRGRVHRRVRTRGARAELPNFLLSFTPTGGRSSHPRRLRDERYHVVEATTRSRRASPQALPGQIELGKTLVAAAQGLPRATSCSRSRTPQGGTIRRGRVRDPVHACGRPRSIRASRPSGLEDRGHREARLRNQREDAWSASTGAPGRRLGGNGQSYSHGLPNLIRPRGRRTRAERP